MSSVKTYDAIKSHLQTTFAPISVIDFDHLDAALEQGKADFLVLEEVYGLEDLAGFGDPSSLCIRETSSLLVHAFVPAPQSSDLARRLAEQVQQSLRLQVLNGVRIESVSPPDPEIQNLGLWTSAVVSVDAVTDSHVARP